MPTAGGHGGASASALSRSSPAVVQTLKPLGALTELSVADDRLGPRPINSTRSNGKPAPAPVSSSRRVSLTVSNTAAANAPPASSRRTSMSNLAAPVPPVSSRRPSLSNSTAAAPKPLNASNPASKPAAKPKVEYGRVAYRSKYDPGTVRVLKEYFDEMIDPATNTVNRDSFRDAFEKRKEQGKIDLFSESFFDVLDADGSESITFKELLRLMFPNANRRDLDYMMDAAYPQKVAAARPTELNEQQKQELTDIFALYDDDSSGEITVAEFRKATQGLGMAKAEIAQMISDIDADGSGTITLEEFLEGMKKAYLGIAPTRQELKSEFTSDA